MTSSSRSNPGGADSAAPRLAALWAAVTYALCTLALSWPALGGGFLVNPHSDQYIGGFPVRDFAAQSIKAGQGIPEWNPYLFGGLPYIAAMHGDIFYPTALLRAMLPTDVAMTWGFILHLFLAGCFTYGFLRAWGLRFFPSLIGGVAYMLSGQVASLASPGHDGKLFVSALLPLTLWFLLRGIRDGRGWAWGGVAIAVGLAVLSPHPQVLQYMLLTAGAFALYLAFGVRVDGTRLPRNLALTRIGFALGAVLLGMLIGAVQYLPVIEYVPWSPRAGGKGYEYATTFSMPIEELVNTYLPQFTGILDRYWGRNPVHLHSEYIGASVLVLASAAFGGGGAGVGGGAAAAGARTAQRSFRRFWLVTGIVALIWALGGSTPFYHIVYAIVPGAKFFRAPSTIFYVVSFSVSMLAALGVERLSTGALSRRFVLGWTIAAAAIALLASTGALTSLAQSIAAGYAGGQLDEAIAGNSGALIAGAWRSFLFVALTLGVALLAQRGRLDRRVIPWALVAVVALDLWSIDRLYWLFSPRASVLYANDPATQYLQRAPTGRVLVAPLSNEGLVRRDANYAGDGLMVHRIRLATGYHGNEIGRYQRLGSKPGSDRYENVFNPALWRLDNVRYLYTNVEVNQPGVTKLLGPVTNSAGSTVYLYRLPGDNPPAWVAPAIVKAGDDAVEGTILDPRFDPLRVAVADSAAPVASAQLTALPEPLPITVNVTRYDPGHIALQLSAPAPAGSALVVSENYFPGWHATVDGKPAQAVRTDFNLIGVPLPASARSVSLDFADRAYHTGRAVTLVAVLLAILWAAAGALTERRRRVA
jgi:hypothetical protein